MKRKSSSKRYVWIGTAVAGAAALAWTLQPAPAVVQTVRVTRGALAATVGSEGKTRVKQHYVVLAPVDGELERIEMQAGASVTVDTVVARIRPVASRPLDARSRTEAVAAVTAAHAAVARADAAQEEATVALEHAQSLLVQSQKLASSAAVPATQAEHLGHDAEIRQHALEEAMAAARQARAELARATAVLSPRKYEGEAIAINSPATGQILRVLRNDAGPVAAGTALLEVGDVSSLEIVADLLSDDAALVRPGAAATVSSWGTKRTIRARVRRIDPAAFTEVSALGLREQKVHVILDFAEPVPAGLGHDYRVDVAIVIWQSANALRVPSTALFRSGDRWSVFTLREGRARLVPVEIGLSDAKWTAVDRGLVEGELVVVQPSDEIRDGIRARP